jgi:hypothetical protein
MSTSFSSYWIRHSVRALGLAIRVGAAAHLFVEFGYDAPRAWGVSMLPTLDQDRAWLLLSHWHRRGRHIEVGDLVSYKIPIFEGHLGIKRVIGMPGDYVLTGMPDDTSNEMIQVISATPLRVQLSGSLLTPCRCRRATAGSKATICLVREIRVHTDLCHWRWSGAKCSPVFGPCGGHNGSRIRCRGLELARMKFS